VSAPERRRQSRGTVITSQWMADCSGIQAAVTGMPAALRSWRTCAETPVPQTVWFSSVGSPAATTGRIAPLRWLIAETW
jgi:hypothetical protein